MVKIKHWVNYFTAPSIDGMSKMLALMLCLPGMAIADPVQQLYKFIYSTPTIRANFHQTVLDSQGAKIQDVFGVMQMQRPGKFRWDYQKPHAQVIVSDGQKVWLFDPALNQVTIRAIDKVVGTSPAALLTGNKNINNIFRFQDAGSKDGLEWVEGSPKEAEGSFDQIKLGFKGNMLHEMKLHDSYGNTTVIELNDTERNPKLESEQFQFNLPPGVDVLDDGS